MKTLWKHKGLNTNKRKHKLALRHSVEMISYFKGHSGRRRIKLKRCDRKHQIAIKRCALESVPPCLAQGLLDKWGKVDSRRKCIYKEASVETQDNGHHSKEDGVSYEDDNFKASSGDLGKAIESSTADNGEVMVKVNSQHGICVAEHDTDIIFADNEKQQELLAVAEAEQIELHKEEVLLDGAEVWEKLVAASSAAPDSSFTIYRDNNGASLRVANVMGYNLPPVLGIQHFMEQMYNFKSRPDDIWLVSYPRSGLYILS